VRAPTEYDHVLLHGHELLLESLGGFEKLGEARDCTPALAPTHNRVNHFIAGDVEVVLFTIQYEFVRVDLDCHRPSSGPAGVGYRGVGVVRTVGAELVLSVTILELPQPSITPRHRDLAAG